MKKTMKKIIATVLTAAMAMSAGMPAFAEESTEEAQKLQFIREELNDTTLSKESIDFLAQNGINDLQEHFNTIAYSNGENLYAGILEEDILALKRAAEANNFTEEQIQKYVEGLLTSSPTIVLESQMISPTADDRKPNDQGVGYEVQSIAGYTQATSFATLPKRSINNLQDIAYLIYTVYVNGGTCMDFGVRGGMYSWVTTYPPTVPEDGVKINKNDGEKIYFNINVEKSGVLRCRILDANDFSNVLCDTEYEMTGVAKNKMIFNKQITFCNNYKVFNSGCKISNGGFDNSYVYTTTGYSIMNSSNTLANRCGVFGIQDVNGSRNMVTVNNAKTSQWDKEDVTITFNLK